MGIGARRNKIREQRRQTILRAARKLFFEKGFKNVTVESIAKKANISKGAVYLHFKSKDEIYTHLLLSEVDRHQKLIKSIVEEKNRASESIRKIALSYVEFFLNDPELFRILMNYMLNPEHLDLTEEMDKKLVTAVNRNIDAISELINAGIEAGEFPRPINVFHHRNIIWGMINGIIALHLFTGPEEKRGTRIRNTLEEGLDIYLRGLKEQKK
ncbi:MAG: TetR/AcrR family transcriptional regulator [Syntrophales bacterium]|nr:TetR/AcrR family transcriptional regulator [Syntrophales bacterium]